MANEEVRQVLGFDTSSAITNLERLETKLGGVNSALERLAQNLRNVNAAGKGFGVKVDTSAIDRGAASIDSGMRRINRATSESRQVVDANIRGMTISFGLLSRIVFTQTVIRSLRTLTSALREAADARISLDRQLGRTAVIDDLGRSVDQLRGDVLQLSSTFNLPIADVAAAQYELLQRGIKSSAEQAEILNAAFQLAKVLGIDANSSVKLLTGTLAAYHKPASEASNVSGQLVQIIKEANVEAGELANGLGPVTAVAAQMGVELSEVGGALTLMTRQGTNTSTALTQTRAVLSGLIKPSESLRALMKDAGLDEMSTQSIGLSGVLTVLRDKAKGNTATMAALLRNVRALSGALQLTSEESLDEFIASIDRVEKAQGAVLKQSFGQVMANEAEQISKAGTLVKNAFTEEFGRSMIELGQNFVQAAGGMDQMAQSAARLGDFAGRLVKILSSPVLGAQIVIRGFITAGTSPTELKRQADEWETVTNAILRQQAAEKSLGEQIAKDKKSFDDLNASIFNLTKDASSRFNNAAKGIESASKGLAANVKSQLGGVSNAFNQVSNAAQNLLGRLLTIQQQTEQLAREADTSLADIRIDSALDKAVAPAQKISILLAESAKLLREGESELRAAGLSEEKRAIALEKLNRSRALAQRAAGETDDQAQATAILTQNTTKYRDAIVGANAALQKQRPQLQALADQLSGLGARADEQLEIIRNNLQQFDAQGNRLPAATLDKQKQNIQGAVKELATLGANLTPQLLEKFGFSPRDIQTITEQIKGLTKTSGDKLKIIADQEALQRQLDTFFDSYRREIKLVAKVDVSGLPGAKDFRTPGDVTKGLTEQISKVEEAQRRLTTAQQTQQQVANNIVQFLPGAQDALSRLDQTQFPDAQRLIALLRGLADPANVNLNTFQQAVQLATQLGNELQKAGQTDALHPLQLLLESLTRIGTPQLKLLNPQDAQLLQQSIQSIQGIGVPASAQIESNLQSAASQLSAAVSALQFAASIPINVPAGGVPALFGKPNYFAAGGMARGLDRIPALLNRNESVINAQATQKFYSQIQALNAGRVPVFHSTSDSSTSVGDTNIGPINIHGGQTNEMTATEVARAIRREIRRGKIKRF